MYQIIYEQREKIAIAKACHILGVDRNCYTDWVKQNKSRKKNDTGYKQLLDDINEIIAEFPLYGYRRVTVALNRMNYTINHKRILRVLRAENLLCKRKKRFKPQTTDSNHVLRVYPNLAKSMEVTGINQLWVADITYVHLKKGFAYLATVLEVFTRKCIGWDLGMSIDAQLALNALTQAINDRKKYCLKDLIHHSDRGVQYASQAYIDKLVEYDIKPSMSRTANPYDNAYAESFFKTFKCEEVYLKEYETFQDALENIGEFIEKIYNQKRLHSSIGYKPPNEYEKEVLSKSIVA